MIGGSPKDMSLPWYPGPVHVSLFGVFADEIRVLRYDHPELLGWTPNPMTSVHDGDGREEDRHRGEGHMTMRAEIEIIQLPAKDALEPPEVGRSKWKVSPRAQWSPANTLIFDFWSPKLGEKRNVLLFSATQFVVICYKNPRKLIHWPQNCPESFPALVSICISTLNFVMPI